MWEGREEEGRERGEGRRDGRRDGWGEKKGVEGGKIRRRRGEMEEKEGGRGRDGWKRKGRENGAIYRILQY